MDCFLLVYLLIINWSDRLTTREASAEEKQPFIHTVDTDLSPATQFQLNDVLFRFNLILLCAATNSTNILNTNQI